MGVAKQENRAAVDALEPIFPQEDDILIDDILTTFRQGFIPIL